MPPTIPSAFLTYGQLFGLFVCLAIAHMVNKFLKRPALNGALLYLVLAAIHLALLMLNLFLAAPAGNPDAVAKAAGGLTGSFLIPVLVAIYFFSKFRKERLNFLSKSSASDDPAS